MRAFIFKLVFGADELAQRMFAMLDLRTKSVKRNIENKELKSELDKGVKELGDLVTKYHQNRVALENAYKLELD